MYQLIKRDFGESLDAGRWIQTANEMIKRDDRIVAILYGSGAKNARMLIMAGNVALEKGINAEIVVKEVSPLLGGGGGGRPNFAQGGGTRSDKIEEAVRKAEEVVKKQIHR